jgi:hypothetical protein
MLNAASLTTSYLRNLMDAEPLAALQALTAVHSYMTAIMAPHVHAARTRGDTWHEIGHALNVSRQGAFNRFAGTSADHPQLF